jgi:uncharacterized protein with GYD domain
MTESEDRLFEIRYLDTRDLDRLRIQNHESMAVAIAVANLLMAMGYYEIISIQEAND